MNHFRKNKNVFSLKQLVIKAKEKFILKYDKKSLKHTSINQHFLYFCKL